MSYPTTPAFVHEGTWDAKTRAHPAMEWMETYTRSVIDSKAFTEENNKFLTPDFTLVKSTGQIINGPDAAFAALKNEIYAPFSKHLHDPVFLVCFENSTGWTMIGIATLYWSLVVPSSEAKVKNKSAEGFDGATPAAFRFDYVKGKDGGIKLSRTDIFSDPSVALVGMLKRGMLKAEDLVGA